MPRDGAVSVNLVTGETASHLSSQLQFFEIEPGGLSSFENRKVQGRHWL